MDDLVARLSTGENPIKVSLRPEATVEALKDSLDRGYVLVTFTGTRGGTELGVPVDTVQTDLSKADFAAGTGTMRLVGALTLNYERVRCIADIDLESLAGHGRLEPIGQTA